MMLVMNEMMAMTATVAVATNACFSIILIFLERVKMILNEDKKDSHDNYFLIFCLCQLRLK